MPLPRMTSAMAKPPKKPKPEDIEPDPGAWERFEHAVDAAVTSGPKHRSKSAPTKPHKTKKESDDRRPGRRKSK